MQRGIVSNSLLYRVCQQYSPLRRLTVAHLQRKIAFMSKWFDKLLSFECHFLENCHRPKVNITKEPKRTFTQNICHSIVLCLISIAPVVVRISQRRSVPNEQIAKLDSHSIYRLNVKLIFLLKLSGNNHNCWWQWMSFCEMGASNNCKE